MLEKLNGFNLKLQEGLAAVRRIFDVLDVKDDIINLPNAKKMVSFDKEIDLILL